MNQTFFFNNMCWPIIKGMNTVTSLYKWQYMRSVRTNLYPPHHGVRLQNLTIHSILAVNVVM